MSMSWVFLVFFSMPSYRRQTEMKALCFRVFCPSFQCDISETLWGIILEHCTDIHSHSRMSCFDLEETGQRSRFRQPSVGLTFKHKTSLSTFGFEGESVNWLLISYFFFQKNKLNKKMLLQPNWLGQIFMFRFTQLKTESYITLYYQRLNLPYT